MTARKQVEALQILIDDHRKVKSLFARFRKLGDDDNDEKEHLIEQVCLMLGAHAQLEEERFYPVLKEKLDDPALVEEAYVEHQVAKSLISRLQDGGLQGPQRDAVFTVLGEYVDHHVQEEEDEIFPKLARTDVDLEALGTALAERKAELVAGMGLDADERDAVSAGTRKEPPGRRSNSPHAVSKG